MSENTRTAHSRPRSTRLSSQTLQQQYGQFLRSDFRWKWFATFTFGRPITARRAEQLFQSFIKLASELMRTSIAFAGSIEYRDSGCGKPEVRPHLHVLLSCADDKARTFLADLWKTTAFGGSRTKGPGADIRVYDPTLGGSFYVIKHANDPEFGLICHNLELIAVKPPSSRVFDKAARKRFRREQRRIKVFQTVDRKSAVQDDHNLQAQA